MFGICKNPGARRWVSSKPSEMLLPPLAGDLQSPQLPGSSSQRPCWRPRKRRWPKNSSKNRHSYWSPSERRCSGCGRSCGGRRRRRPGNFTSRKRRRSGPAARPSHPGCPSRMTPLWPGWRRGGLPGQDPCLSSLGKGLERHDSNGDGWYFLRDYSDPRALCLLIR